MMLLDVHRQGDGRRKRSKLNAELERYYYQKPTEGRRWYLDEAVDHKQVQREVLVLNHIIKLPPEALQPGRPK